MSFIQTMRFKCLALFCVGCNASTSLNTNDSVWGVIWILMGLVIGRGICEKYEAKKSRKKEA